MATRMQQRRGTSTEWAAANPVLADGEIGYAKDTGVIKIGDGGTLWNDLDAALEGLYLPVGGKAFDSDRLDGLDQSSFARVADVNTYNTTEKDRIDKLILPAGVNRTLVNHSGNVTSFPSSPKIGDRCFRTDLFCEMYWNGGVWRQAARAGGTSTQRAAINRAGGTALYDGFEFYETDTKFMRRYDGTYWEIVKWHGSRQGSAYATTSMGSNPGFPAVGGRWANAAIPNNSSLPYINWPSVATMPTTYADAGDTGQDLFTVVNTAGATWQCNAKGRVRVTLLSTSDHAAAGRSSIWIITNSMFNGWLADIVDTRHRATGYGTAGLLEQCIQATYDVLPGDTFGCGAFQVNTAANTATYQTWMQVQYL